MNSRRFPITKTGKSATLLTMTRFTVLSEEQIAKEIEQMPEWRVDEGQLKATYTFADFRTAFAFITLIAIEAEKVDHHPEWTNVYNRVDFAFATHDAGNKITDLDTAMARYISRTARKFSA